MQLFYGSLQMLSRREFQLVMFDFDGVLVDSERAHYRAYQAMCHGRNVPLSWDFATYCSYAHYSSTAVQEALYQHYPQLYVQEPNWHVLYAEKTRALVNIYRQGDIALMPGAAVLLEALEQQKMPRCVVTHSAKDLVDMLRSQHPVLNTIPHWITREEYAKAKPAPDGYLVAMQRLLPPGGKAIGFEDTPRGLQALLASGATAVLVPQCEYPEIPDLLQRGALFLPSLPSN